MEYQKRSGTSGIDGQLYETKLLALILFRLQRDRSVEYFYLGSNIDRVGAFDDVCIVMKKIGQCRPVAMFIQIKHKENKKMIIKLDHKEKLKYVNSFIQVKRAITSRQHYDNFFDGTITETDYTLILYTNAHFNLTTSLPNVWSRCATEANAVLTTGDTDGHTVQHSEEQVQYYANLFLKEDLILLAKHFANFMNDINDEGEDSSMNMMRDTYIQQYHVILRLNVVNVSDIERERDNPKLQWRKLSFKDNFFTSEDQNTSLFRDQLIKQVLQNQRKEAPQDLISVFLSNPSAATLAPLIITHVQRNEDGELRFQIERPPGDIEQLRKIDIPPSTIDMALHAAKTVAMEYLRSRQLKVPIAFGNMDLIVRGSPKKIDRRLDYLATTISKLCEQSKLNKAVTIDDTLDDGLLAYNGGIASAVGNLLTYDDVTKMLKVSNSFTAEQINAKTLFDKLNEQIKAIKEGINNVHEYTFDVKTNKFPKLHLDGTGTAREFLNKLIIYQQQSNQSEMEKILRKEIQEHVDNDAQYTFINPDSVFLHYHEEIVKWWSSRGTGTYLTKTSRLYQQAMDNINTEPHISDLHTTFYMNNLIYFEYEFSEAAIQEMDLPEVLSQMFIVTDTVTLTTVKVIQSLRNNYSITNCAVLDVGYVYNMSLYLAYMHRSLCAELRKTNKVIVIVCAQSNMDSRILHGLGEATQNRRLVVITNNALKEEVMQHFSCTSDVFKEEIQSLSSMTPESQTKVRECCTVNFQGQDVILDSIVDDESIKFIKGILLDKMIRNDSIYVSTSLTNPSYEETKHMYIDRRVKRVNDASYDSNRSRYLVKTFLDVIDIVVLLTAPAGMGKSTLITHLSLQTKQNDKTIWIVRVNFIDHSEQFQEWHDRAVAVDALESLKFLCGVILKNTKMPFTVALKNGRALLVNSPDDALATFQLNMFLHFYNQRKLILVYDGFDEICPHYKDKVLDFLSVSKTSLRKKRMWVTSRPYSNILSDLQSVLRKGFKIEHLSYTEQEKYLKTFWRVKSINEELSKHLKHLESCVQNTIQSISEARNWIQFIYCVFIDTVRPYLRRSQIKYKEIDTLLKRFRKKSVEDTLSGVPLILYFIAEYFMTVVDINKNCSKPNYKINLHEMYKTFIENKLKKILMQEKNNMDLSKTITRLICEKELPDCINIHKKLAAYALFQDTVFKNLDFEEFEPLKPFTAEALNIELSKIKTGANLAGLISTVTTQDIPTFIHRSFTEYFAAEYVCDILKSGEFDVPQRTLWYCAVTECTEGVKEWIDTRKETDSTLERVLKEIEEPSPIFKTEYREYLKRDNLTQGQYVRMLASSINDYENGCLREFGKRFDKIQLKTLDKGNQRQLVEYLTSYFISRMKPHLKKYFVGPVIYRLLNKNLIRDFGLAKDIDTLRYIHDRQLIINIVGQGRFVPYFMQLVHTDKHSAFETIHDKTEIKCINISFNMNNNYCCENIDETDLICLLFVSDTAVDISSHAECELTRANAFNNSLKVTNTTGHPLHYSEQHIETLADVLLKKELSLLARRIVTLFDMTAQRAHITSYLNYCDYRLIFQSDFLNSDDKYIALLRSNVIDEILNTAPNTLLQNFKPDSLISQFFTEPSAATLTPLIGAHILNNNDGELNFATERPSSDIEQLQQVNIPRSIINEVMLTVRMATTEYLRSLQLIVKNLEFDNIVHDNRELIRLVYAIFELCKQYEQTESHKVVTIDDQRFHNTLVTCLICGILTRDEETTLVKFTKYSTQSNILMLLIQLSEQIENLHDYRFDIRFIEFPRLHLYYVDTARQLLSGLIFYAEQDHRYEVESIYLKENQEGRDEPSCTGIMSELAFLHYNSQVVRWWMSFQIDSDLLTTNHICNQAAINITSEPVISRLHTNFYVENFRYFKYSLDTSIINWLEMPALYSIQFIVSDTTTLTTVQVLKCLRDQYSVKECAVMDLELVANMPTEEFSSLCTELSKTEKVVVIRWHDTRSNSHSNIKLYDLVRAVKKERKKRERLIVIKKKHLPCTNTEVQNKTGNWSETYLEKEIMKGGKVIFQGRKINVNLIVEEGSASFVTGFILEKMMLNETINIGTKPRVPRAEAEDLHVYRRVSGVYRDILSSRDVITTFVDIAHEVVVLMAPPRTTKSTLLTRLSVNTIRRHVKLWIVRVNFSDHSKQFQKWYVCNTVISVAESLTFLCQVALSNTATSFQLEMANDEARLGSCTGDELAIFELNMFLHFYNNSRLIFIFDGLDEICTHYKNKVLDLLLVTRSRLRKCRMWIASRPYCVVLSNLLNVLDTYSMIRVP